MKFTMFYVMFSFVAFFAGIIISFIIKDIFPICLGIFLVAMNGKL